MAGRPHWRLLSAVALLGCGGCLAPFSGLSEGRVLRTEAGDVLLKWAPHDFDQERAARAIERAGGPLHRWGKLRRAVTFSLLPSQLRFQAAVRRFGYGWLHTWARYDEVYFQSPSTWGASDPDVDELVLHELTHCLMYQRSASAESWGGTQIPVWFREGMASWTAKQGYGWPGLEDLAVFYEKNPGADPLAPAEALFQERTEIVYAAAHHAFSFLVRRLGEPAVQRLLDGMAEGRAFPEAFELVTGITAAAFEREFRLYVVWRGFRAPGPPPAG